MFGAEKVTVESVIRSVFFPPGEAMTEAATICKSNFKVRKNNPGPFLLRSTVTQRREGL